MNEKQLKFLWDNYANNKGFVNYDEFKSLMASDNNRKLFFDDSNKELGFTDYNEFETILGVKKKGGTTQEQGQPAQQPTKPSTPSFGQKVVTEALVSGEPVMKGVQKKPVEKKPYQDITYRREELPSETTQMPETPVVKAAKKDFKESQLKPPVQVKSTPEELEEIQKKTEKVDKTGLILNDYQSTGEIVTDLESLNEGDVNAVFTRIQRRPDLYAKYSGRTPEEIANFQGYQTRELYEADRDLVYKNYLADLESQKLNHDKAVKKANIVSNEIIKSTVTPESYRNFVKDKTETTSFGEITAGPVIDMDAVDREASAIAEKYNLPTDGEAWRLLKNNIKSQVNTEIDRPQAEINFNNDYPELSKKRKELFEGGFKADESIYAKVDSQLSALESQYQEDAKREFGLIDAEYKQKADNLNKQYADYTAQIKQQQDALTALYQSGQMDQLDYETAWGKLSDDEKTFYENYKREFPDVTQYVVKANEINSKYNRKFELQKQAIASRAEAEMQAAFKKYAAEYKEDPEVLRQINEAYRASFEKANGQRTAKMQTAAQLSINPISSFYQSTASALGGVFKGWGGSLNSKTLELLGESMEQTFMMPKARTEEFSDWVDPQNAILLAGQLAGSQIPSMTVGAAVAVGTQGAGLPVAAQLIAGGLAGWASETVDIVGRSYLDRFERTGGNVAEANLAAQRSLQSQYDIMFSYSLDALPFVGKALKFIPTKAGRVVTGGVVELGTEMIQEYPQNIADENIQAGNEPWTNLNEALKDTKRMKETLISIGPVAILGGASQLGTKSRKSELRDANIALQQKSSLNDALPDQKRQYIQNMVFSKNAKFAKGVIGNLFATGQIDEQTSKDLLVEIERSEKIKESGKSAGLSGSKLNIYGFYSARAEEAEKNAAKFGNDPILSESYKQMAKQYRDAGLDFMKGNNPDLLTLTYADGSQAIMVPEDVNALFSDATALSLLNSNAISIQAYREGGQGEKIIEELKSRVESYAQTNRYAEAAKVESPMQALRQTIDERISQLEAERPELEEKQKQEEFDRIERELYESFSSVGESFIQSEQERRNQGVQNRDAEVEILQSQRKSLGIDDVMAFFSDMRPLVGTTVERMEQGNPAPQSAVKAASDYLYAKYKELSAMKSDPNRMMTVAQIESIQTQIEQDLETLAGTPPSQKIETRDQENIQGIPSQVREGQEPIATQPVESTSQESAPTGGVLQAQKEVTPAATPEPAVKPSRRERLAKMFETSEGEVSAEKVANFLGEANIGVEILDAKAFEETGKQRNFEGGADGIFIVDNNTGKIYLNKDKIKGAEGKTLAFHEGIHPVVNIIRNTNPKLYRAIVDGLKAEAVKNAGVAKAAEAVASSKYYQEQGPSAIEDETVVETMARVAAGDIDIDTFEPSLREKFIEFMNKLAKMLGLKPIAVNSPRMEVKRLADQLSKALNEGGKLSDIVGKENVGKFQNKINLDNTESVFSNTTSQARFDMNFFEDSEDFKKLVEEGRVVHNAELSQFENEVVVIHNPDNFFTGNMKFRGKDLVEGEGGIYFVLKYGDVWASGKKLSATQMSSLINESLKRSTDGKARIVLIKGDPNKNLTSVKGAKALMGVLEILADDGLIPLSAFRKALNAAGKKYKINFDGRSDARSIHKDIQSKFMNVSNSSFERRGDFVRDVIDEIAKQDVLSKENISKIAESIGAKRKMTTFSKASILDSVSYATSERMLQDIPNSHAYAVIEISSKVKPDLVEKHESYPWHIVSEDGSKPILYILKNRPYFDDVLVAAKNTEKVKEGDKFGDVSRAGLAQRGMGLAKVQGAGQVAAQASISIPRGKYEVLPGAPTPKDATGPIPELVDIAESYAKKFGVPYTRQGEYVKADEEFGTRIANAYESMKHDPKNPKVKEAYDDLIRQTTDQYNALMDAGYEFTFFDGKTDPYNENPMNAMRDLRANKKMAVYGTYAGYGTEGITGASIEDNPMLAPTGLQWADQNGIMRDVTANDLFRAVHDAFGHGLEGAAFRARGEENAWQAHARLFTGPAVAAITTETRGQNSWLNFNPKLLKDVAGVEKAKALQPDKWQTITVGEHNRTAKLDDTIFAEQKTGLMPEWTWTERVAPAMQEETAKPIGQPSMLNRTPAEVQRLMEDSLDAVDQAIADGVDAETAVANNVTSQDWYAGLTPKQKEQFDEIIKDEFGVTPKAPVAKPTGIKASIESIVDNYYKLKDGDRAARAAINEILGRDPKLKYIYDNISKINKQLQDAGVITDKTDGCP